MAVEFAGVGSLKALTSGPGDGSQLRVVTEWLQRCDLDVVIQLKGETIATLGRDAAPGAFEKMFSLGAVDIKKHQLIKALFKRGD